MKFLEREINHIDDKTFIDDLFVMGHPEARTRQLAIETVSLLQDMGVPLREMFLDASKMCRPSLEQSLQANEDKIVYVAGIPFYSSSSSQQGVIARCNWQ